MLVDLDEGCFLGNRCSFYCHRILLRRDPGPRSLLLPPGFGLQVR